MKPVVVGIRDGLGNQLFQFASGYALARRLGVPLDLDISWYSSNVDATPRQFRIGDLIPRHAYRNVHKNYGLARLQADRFVRFGRLSRARAYRFGVPIYNTKPTDEMPISSIHEPAYIQGWPFDFRDLEEVLFEIGEFIWNKLSTLGQSRVRSSSYSFIHVRRGDYVSSKKYTGRYVLLDREYYSNAIRLYESNFGTKHWILCSDAPKEAMQMMPENADIKPSCVASELGDFKIMMEAEGGIISNSTFSFWASLLNRECSSNYVAPTRWTNDGSKEISIPKTWLLV